MRRPAVFLDRDGTLIEDRGVLRDPSEVVFYPTTAQALRRLGSRYELFVITNQRGIAEGAITMAECERVNRHVLDVLRRAGVIIRAAYVCPHRREDGCGCIKPKPHFPQRAALAYGLDLRRSYAVGDHPHDVELGFRMGGRGVYVLTGHGHRHRDELGVPCTIAPNIDVAADVILRESGAARGARSLAPHQAEPNDSSVRG